MALDRRGFITKAASAAALGACPALAGAAARPEPKFIWSYLAHFGVNSWKDIPLETEDPTKPEKWLTRCCANHVRFDEPSWRRLSDALAKAGCNQIVIDLAEFVVYPSHPELAVRGSWSVERLRAELARLRGMGFEVIPKMNFSACHDTWLKEYHRMVSTKRYYQVCEDLIKDVAEIFDRPRFFHLGYDEETAAHQAQHLFAVCRQGELWWHDFLWFAGEAGRHGARPWIWSDYIWHHRNEFTARMPRSVLQSNWYYDRDFVDAERLPAPAKGHEFFDERVYARTFADLDASGFDQVPCGSNCGCDGNFPAIVRHCRDSVSKERLKGFLMAPWLISLEVNRAKLMSAVRIFGQARKEFGA